MTRALLCLGLAAFPLAAPAPSAAQLPTYADDPFRQLDEVLPTPDEIRLASGAPGPNYWQQRADYRIKVALDDQKQGLTGSDDLLQRAAPRGGRHLLGTNQARADRRDYPRGRPQLVPDDHQLRRAPMDLDWRQDSKAVRRMIVSKKEITGIEFDPLRETADADRHNNYWPQRPVESRFRLHKDKKEKNPMQEAKEETQRAKKAKKGQN